MSTAAITGANGFLGSRLARRMAAAGWTIRRLQRNGRRAADAAKHEPLRFVLSEALDVAALEGVDVLVHCAHDYDAVLPDMLAGTSHDVLLAAGRSNLGATRVRGGALFDAQGTLIGSFGEAPDLSPALGRSSTTTIRSGPATTRSSG